MRNLLAALLLSLTLAGCAGSSSVFHVDATNPMVMAPPTASGFGYDGSGMIQASGTMTIHALNSGNTGYVHLDVNVPSGPNKGHYIVNWTDFHIQSGATWQDGGIACGPGLVEHGASGHGNKMEPQFDLDCGGWGSATATRDGQAVKDPVTGASSFNAHFMATKEAMLQNGKVLKADKTTPFDPNTPGDGSVDSSRKEAHFALWGSGAYANGIAVIPKPATTYLNDTATGAVTPVPTYSKTAPVVVSGGASARLHLDISGGPSPPGQVSITLLDPKGAAAAGFTVNPLMPRRDLDVPATLTAGNYTMRIDAQGAMVAYHASVTVTPATPFLLHVVFQDVQVE